MDATPRLGPRFTAALTHATEWHEGQTRKGTSIPYISHPLRVCSLVLDDGGSEVEACAALLHDAVEDTPTTHDDVLALFGPEVARIVRMCSDDDGTAAEKPPWYQRKVDHLVHLRHDPDFDASAARVMAADKLANLTSQLEDAERLGPASWDRFKGGIAGTRWYVESAGALVASKLDPGSALRRALRARVDHLRRMQEDVRARLGGRDRRIDAALACVAVDLPGWCDHSRPLAAFEIARAIVDDGRHAADATVNVFTGWFEPQPRERALRARFMESAPERLRPVIDAVILTNNKWMNSMY